MSASETIVATPQSAAPKLVIPHVIKGRLVEGDDIEHRGFSTPAIDLDQLIWPRHELPPALDLPIAEVIDFLVALGDRLQFDRNQWLQDAVDLSVNFNPLGRRIIEAAYRGIPHFFRRESLEFLVAQEIGAPLLDGWTSIAAPSGTALLRAYPPRLVHVLAGNTPGVAAWTIVRGALTKGVHLLKLPANDLLTATAMLRTMADLDPDHPVTRSFSAVYWRGGDTAIESAILRPQFFDKMAVWGGEAAIRTALRYAGPGFEIVSFDPKVSMSMLGKEAYDNDETLDDAVERAANDVAIFNQDACVASRFIYAEGSVEEVDRFCERLAVALGKDRATSSARTAPPPADLQNEVNVLRTLEPLYRVWGDYTGAGLVIRSDDPVDFYPVSKTVNVVMVPSLSDAVGQANVATQTVGIYPAHRAKGLRDILVSYGVQRIVTLGEVARSIEGMPHDGFYPMRRFMRWIVDETPGW
jgi:hypothetical protein